jgi:hypothetical protein
LPSIHLRHLNVQENDIRTERCGHRQRFRAILRGTNRVAGHFQHQRERLARISVVLYHQQVHEPRMNQLQDRLPVA